MNNNKNDNKSVEESKVLSPQEMIKYLRNNNVNESTSFVSTRRKLNFGTAFSTIQDLLPNSSSSSPSPNTAKVVHTNKKNHNNLKNQNAVEPDCCDGVIVDDDDDAAIENEAKEIENLQKILKSFTSTTTAATDSRKQKGKNAVETASVLTNMDEVAESATTSLKGQNFITHINVDSTRTASVLSLIMEDAKNQLFSSNGVLASSGLEEVLSVQTANALAGIEQARERAAEFSNYLPQHHSHHQSSNKNRSGTNSNNTKNEKGNNEGDNDDDNNYDDVGGDRKNNNKQMSKTPSSKSTTTTTTAAAHTNHNNNNKTHVTNNSNTNNSTSLFLQATRSFEASDSATLQRRSIVVAGSAFLLQQKLNQWKFLLPTNSQETTRREQEITKILRDFDSLARRCVAENLEGRIESHLWPFATISGYSNHHHLNTSSVEPSSASSASTISAIPQYQNGIDNFFSLKFDNNNNNNIHNDSQPQQQHKEKEKESQRRAPKPPSQCRPFLSEASWISTQDGLRCVILSQPRLLDMWGHDVGEILRAARDEIKNRSHILHNCLSCRRNVQVPLCTVVVAYGIPVFVEAHLGLTAKSTVIGGGVFTENFATLISTVTRDGNAVPLNGSTISNGDQLNTSYYGNSYSSALFSGDHRPPLDSFANRGVTCDEFKTNSAAAAYVLRSISYEFGLAPHRLLKDPVLYLNNDCEIHLNPFDHFIYIRNVRRLFAPVSAVLHSSLSQININDNNSNNNNKPASHNNHNSNKTEMNTDLFANIDTLSVLDEEERKWFNYLQEQQEIKDRESEKRKAMMEALMTADGTKKDKDNHKPSDPTSSNTNKPTSSSKITITTTKAVSQTESTASVSSPTSSPVSQQQALLLQQQKLLARRTHEPVIKFRPEFWSATFRRHPATFLSSDAFRALSGGGGNGGSTQSLAAQLSAGTPHDRNAALATSQLYNSCISNFTNFLFSEVMSMMLLSRNATRSIINWTSLPLSLVPRLFHAFGVNFSLSGYVLRRLEKELMVWIGKNEDTSSAATSSILDRAREISRASPVFRAIRFEMASRCASDVLALKIREILFANTSNSNLGPGALLLLSSISSVENGHQNNTVPPLFPASSSPSSANYGNKSSNLLLMKRQIESAAKKFIQLAMNDSSSDVLGEEVNFWRDQIIPRMRAAFGYEPFCFPSTTTTMKNMTFTDSPKGSSAAADIFLPPAASSSNTMISSGQQQSKDKSASNQPSNRTAMIRTTGPKSIARSRLSLPASSSSSHKNSENPSSSSLLRHLLLNSAAVLPSASSRPAPSDFDFSNPGSDPILAAMYVTGQPISVTNRIDVKPWGQTDMNQTEILSPSQKNSAHGTVAGVTRAVMTAPTKNAFHKSNKIQNEDVSNDDVETGSNRNKDVLNFVVNTTLSFPAVSLTHNNNAATANENNNINNNNSVAAPSTSSVTMVHYPVPNVNNNNTSNFSVFRDEKLDYLFTSTVLAAELKATIDANSNSNHNNVISTYFRDTRQDWRFAERLLQLCGIVLGSDDEGNNNNTHHVSSTAGGGCNLVPVTCASLLYQEPLFDKSITITSTSNSKSNNDPLVLFKKIKETMLDQILKPSLSSQQQQQILVLVPRNVNVMNNNNNDNEFKTTTIQNCLLVPSTTTTSSSSSNTNINTTNLLPPPPPSDLCFLDYWFKAVELARCLGDAAKYRSAALGCVDMLHREYPSSSTISDLGIVPLLMSVSRVDADSGALVSALENGTSAVSRSEASLQGTVFLIQCWENIMDCVRATENALHGTGSTTSLLLLQQQQLQQKQKERELLLLSQQQGGQSKSKFTSSSHVDGKKDANNNNNTSGITISSEFISRLRNETSEKLRIAAKSIADSSAGATLSATESLEQLSVLVFNFESDSLVRSAILRALPQMESLRHEIFAAVADLCGLRSEEVCPSASLTFVNSDVKRMKESWMDACKAALSLALQQGALPSKKSVGIFSQLIFKITSFVEAMTYKLIFSRNNSNNNTGNNDDNGDEDEFSRQQQQNHHKHPIEQEKIYVGKQIEKIRKNTELFQRFTVWITRIARVLTRSSSTHLHSSDTCSALATLSQSLLSLHTQIRCDVEFLDTLYKKATVLSTIIAKQLANHNHSSSTTMMMVSLRNNDSINNHDNFGVLSEEDEELLMTIMGNDNNNIVNNNNLQQQQQQQQQHQQKIESRSQSHAGPRSQSHAGARSSHYNTGTHQDGVSSAGTEDTYAPPSVIETVRNRGIGWFFGDNNSHLQTPSSYYVSNSSSSSVSSPLSVPKNFLQLSSKNLDLNNTSLNLLNNTSNLAQIQQQLQQQAPLLVSPTAQFQLLQTQLPDAFLISNHDELQTRLDRDTVLFFRQWMSRLLKDVPDNQIAQSYSWDASLQRALSELMCSAHRFSIYPEISLRLAREISASVIARCTTVDGIWAVQKRRALEKEKAATELCRENGRSLDIKLMQHPLRLMRIGMLANAVPFSVLPILLDVGASLLLCALTPPWREERNKQKLMQMKAMFGVTGGGGGVGSRFGGNNNNNNGAATKPTSLIGNSNNRLFLSGGQHSKMNILRAQHARSTQQHLQEYVQSQIPTHTVWFPNGVQVRNRPAFYLSSAGTGAGEYIVSFANNLSFRETFSSSSFSKNASSSYNNNTYEENHSDKISPTLNPEIVCSDTGKDPYSALFPKTIDIAFSGADRWLTFCEEVIYLLHFSVMSSTTSTTTTTATSSQQNMSQNFPDRRTNMEQTDLQQWFTELFERESCFGLNENSNSINNNNNNTRQQISSSAVSSNSSVTGGGGGATSNNNSSNKLSSTASSLLLPSRESLPKWFMPGTWAQSPLCREQLMKAINEVVKSNHEVVPNSSSSSTSTSANTNTFNKNTASSPLFVDPSSASASSSSPTAASPASPTSGSSPKQNADDAAATAAKRMIAPPSSRLELAAQVGRLIAVVLYNVLLPLMAELRILDELSKFGLTKDARRGAWCEVVNLLLRIVKLSETTSASIPIEESVLMHIAASRRDFLLPHYLNSNSTNTTATKEQPNTNNNNNNNNQSSPPPPPPPLYLTAIPKELSAAYANVVHRAHLGNMNNNKNKNVDKNNNNKFHKNDYSSNNQQQLLQNHHPIQWQQTLLEAEKRRLFVDNTKNNNNKSPQQLSSSSSPSLSGGHLGSLLIIDSIFSAINNNNSNNSDSNASTKIPEEAFSFKAGGRVPRFEECYFRLFVMICACQVGHYELGAMPNESTNNYNSNNNNNNNNNTSTGGTQNEFEHRAEVVRQHLETRMREEDEILKAILDEKKQLLANLPKKTAGGGTVAVMATMMMAASISQQQKNAAAVDENGNDVKNKDEASSPTHQNQQNKKKQQEAKQQRQEQEQLEQSKLLQQNGVMTISPHVIALPQKFVSNSSTNNNDDEKGSHQKTATFKVPLPTISVSWILPNTATPTRPTLAVLSAHGTRQLKDALIKISSFEIRTVRGQTIVPFVVPPAPSKVALAAAAAEMKLTGDRSTTNNKNSSDNANRKYNADELLDSAELQDLYLKDQYYYHSLLGEYVFGYFTDSRPDHTPILVSEIFKVIPAKK